MITSGLSSNYAVTTAGLFIASLMRNPIEIFAGALVHGEDDELGEIVFV